MTRRLSWLVAFVVILIAPAFGKDKNKTSLPEYVLRAQTVKVVIDPDAGEAVDQPTANATARENVEKALMDWGRFRLVLDGQESDLIISVRTGNGKAMRPTVKGGPIDQRPGIGQGTDDSIRIGAQRGQPPMSDPKTIPQDRGPHISNEIGPSDDSFAVYRGGGSDALDSSPVWRYLGKDALRAPKVAAVEEFRKAVADAEKPKPPKNP